MAGSELRIGGRGGCGAALGPAVVAAELLRCACGTAAVARQIRTTQRTGRTTRGRWRRGWGQCQGQPWARDLDIRTWGRGSVWGLEKG